MRGFDLSDMWEGDKKSLFSLETMLAIVLVYLEMVEESDWLGSSSVNGLWFGMRGIDWTWRPLMKLWLAKAAEDAMISSSELMVIAVVSGPQIERESRDPRLELAHRIRFL